MKLEITREHIKEGIPGEPSWCPIACAIAEKYSVPNSWVGVEGSDSIFISTTDYWLDLDISDKDKQTINDFIDAFDFIEDKSGKDIEQYRDNLPEISFNYKEINRSRSII